jgi:hypothetical protein
MDVKRDLARADADREIFERFGLGATVQEPRRVYCLKCGAEIEPLTKQTWGMDAWWKCPRGCNRDARDTRIH